MSGYIVTQEEARRLKNCLAHLSTRLGLPLRTSQDEGKDATLLGENAPLAALSRHTIRLFALFYALTNAYENLAIGLLRRKAPSLFIRDVLSKSSAGFAAFIASYSLAYRSLRLVLRACLASLATSFRHMTHSNGHETDQRRQQLRPRLRATCIRVLRSRSTASALAGAFAAPTILLDPSSSRRVTMVLYAVARAFEVSWRAACLEGWVPKAMRETRWWFGPHLLFALSNAQLLHAFVFDPECFPSSYSNFILRFSEGYIPQKPDFLAKSAPWPEARQVVDVLASTARSEKPFPKFESPLIYPSISLTDKGAVGVVKPVLDLAHPLHKRLICATLHPDEPACTKVATTFAKREFTRATRFMAILSVVRILFAWRKAKAHPFTTLAKAASFSVSSGAALAACIGVAWSSNCFLQAYLPGNVLPTGRLYVQGFIGGLFVLLSPARSAELGLYSARLAALVRFLSRFSAVGFWLMCAKSAWQVALKRKRVRPIRYGEIIPLAVSAGALMALHERGPTGSTTGMLKRLLDRVAPPE